jgi:hypothetical protein
MPSWRSAPEAECFLPRLRRFIRRSAIVETKHEAKGAAFRITPRRAKRSVPLRGCGGSSAAARSSKRRAERSAPRWCGSSLAVMLSWRSAREAERSLSRIAAGSTCRDAHDEVRRGA